MLSTRLCQSHGVRTKMGCQANLPGSIVNTSRETLRAGKVRSWPTGILSARIGQYHPNALAGDPRHWILEMHFVSPDGRFGGFYERLLEGPPSSSSADSRQDQLRDLSR